MASNENLNGVASKTPDLPQVLADAVLRAELGCFPTFTDEERKKCPHLYEMLSPSLVNDPNHRGKGDPKKVLREPLLMISWDRLNGAWKWAVSDKILNIGGGGTLGTLIDVAGQIEAQLGSGTVPFKRRKVS